MLIFVPKLAILTSHIVFLNFVEKDWVHYCLLSQVESLPSMSVLIVSIIIILGSVLENDKEKSLEDQSNNVSLFPFDVLPIEIVV